jgi:hypothetical protein
MKRISISLLGLILLLPMAVRAQPRWDAPSFMRPGSPAGLTLALIDTDPGAGLGVLALWRGAAAPTGIGFRAGITEAPGDEVAGLIGIDVSGSLSGPVASGEPEVLWWTGAGVGLGNDVSASFPLGLVFGWTARDEGVSFMPYAGGHMVLDVLSGPGDDLDLDGVVDLGLDLMFSGRWVMRLGIGLGGRDSVGFGVGFPR